MLSRKFSVNDQRDEWLRKIRADWFRVMRPLGSYVPWDLKEQVALDEESEVEDYFRLVPSLAEIHVKNCRVVPDRFALLANYLQKHGICCEVGTDKGEFAKKIVESSQPRKLHIIDKSFESFNRVDFEPKIESGTVVLHESDSARAMESFQDGYFDWIYIDADNSYEGVKRDIEACKGKIKTTGMLAFRNYVYWSHRELMAYGVMHAVNEFCLSEHWELVYLALHNQGNNGAVIRKIF